jgi:hypothetical protein
MSELRPLCESSEDAAARDLLHAGRSDAPEREFSERLLIGLGLGVAAGTVSAMATTGTAAALPGAASTGSGAASVSALVAKWVAVSVVGGGILAGGAHVALSPPSAAPVPSIAKPLGRSVPGALPTAKAAPGTAPVVSPLEAPPLASPELLPEAEPEASQPPSAGAARPGQLGREVESIDRARRALGAGNLRQALRELDTFERVQGTGVLAREARVLRIEVLFRLGRVVPARQLLEQYRQSYPNDPHVARLRALVPEQTE